MSSFFFGVFFVGALFGACYCSGIVWWNVRGVPFSTEQVLAGSNGLDDFTIEKPLDLDRLGSRFQAGTYDYDFRYIGVSSSLGITSENDTEDWFTFEVPAGRSAYLISYSFNFVCDVDSENTYVNTAVVGKLGEGLPFVVLSPDIRFRYGIKWDVPPGYGVVIIFSYPQPVRDVSSRRVMNFGVPVSPSTGVSAEEQTACSNCSWYAPYPRYDVVVSGEAESLKSVRNGRDEFFPDFIVPCMMYSCFASGECRNVVRNGPRTCLCPPPCSYPISEFPSGSYRIVFWETNSKRTHSLYFVGLRFGRISLV